MTSVFLSHSSADVLTARRLRDDLVAAGIEVWFDEEQVWVGDDIRRGIEDGLRRCDFFVILLSRASVRSTWVQSEISSAFAAQMDLGHGSTARRILPVLVEPGVEVPDLLRGLHRVDIGTDHEGAVAELVRTLTAVDVTVQSMGGFTLHRLRQGDRSSPNRLASTNLVLESGDAGVFVMIKSQGSTPLAVEATDLVHRTVLQVLSAALELGRIDGERVIQTTVLVANQVVRDLVARTPSGFVGSAMAMAVVMPRSLITIEVGDCGGILHARRGEDDLYTGLGGFVSAVHPLDRDDDVALHFATPIGHMLTEDGPAGPMRVDVRSDMAFGPDDRLILTSSKCRSLDEGRIRGLPRWNAPDRDHLVAATELCGVRRGADFHAISVTRSGDPS